MTRSHGFLLALTFLLGVGGAARAQSFVLGLDGPATLSGPEGSVVTASYFCTLTPLDPGLPVSGYQIILAAENAVFTGITIDGTTAGALLDTTPCWFAPDIFPECSFLTNQMGNGMACNAVILSLQAPIFLPTEGTSTIARVDIQAVVPSCGGTATIQYVDASGCFAGAASTTVITANSTSYGLSDGLVTQVPEEIELESTSGCDPAVLLGALIEEVNALEAPQGTTAALGAILSVALGILTDASAANDAAAVRPLDAFIRLVDAQRGTKISPADADSLIAAARRIAGLLGGA